MPPSPTAGGADALMERTAPLGALAALLERVTARRDGTLALVGGEAGIGKSALVRAFAERCCGGARVLSGACDPLSTPRPLGPLADLAEDVGGSLVETLTP